MYSVSNHTAQINCWIALTKTRDEYSHSLAGIGYECDFIEGTLNVEGEVSNPDIVLTSSRKDHSVAIECKGDGIDEDQFDRYQLLISNPESLLNASRFEEDLSISEFESEICYSSFVDLSNRRAFLTNNAAFVHFQRTTSGIFLTNLHEFESNRLSEAFPINMDPDEEIPIEYYPFDIENKDDYREFVSAIIQAILRTSIRDGVFDVGPVLDEAHPYWDYIGENKQEKFKKEAKKVLEKLKHEDLFEFIENIADSDSEWKVHHKTADAIQERLNDPEFVEKVAKVVDQTTVTDDE